MGNTDDVVELLSNGADIDEQNEVNTYMYALM